MSQLDVEETEILEAFESGKLKRVENLSEEIDRHRRIAAATFKKDSRISIRISSKDLRALQKRALQEGIPYQTFVASVLHKFVEGKLVDHETIILSVQDWEAFLSALDNTDRPRPDIEAAVERYRSRRKGA